MADFKKLVAGEVLSETQFYVVDLVKGDKVRLITDSGEPVVLDEKYVTEFLNSAAQFDKEEKISRTEMTNKLLSHPRTAMTLSFNKQVKEADIVKEIISAYEGSTPKDFTTALKKSVKKGMSGEERIMTGRHYGTTDEFGRIQFIDMNADKGTNPAFDGRQRLVDPRTLNWIIVSKVKYLIK